MNVSIYHNSTDITTKVIDYDRRQYICTGVGSLILTVKTIDDIYTTYDTIEIYEEGTKKGTYYISVVEKQVSEGKTILTCQDGSKRLTDYYIPRNDTVVDEATYVDHWVKIYLDEAGVSYVFDTLDGNNLVQNDTTLGPGTAMDVITPLLGQCGWYLYFDPDNVCHISHINKDLEDYDVLLTDNTILDYSDNKNDKMLRNRGLVWGKGNPQGKYWTFSDLKVTTPYNYDDQDVRTIVVSNSRIYDNGSAKLISKQLLKEFARITYEKVVRVAGNLDVTVGDTVFLNSKYYTGICLITSLEVNVSSTGFITTLNLDQRCPKLFAYYDYGGYVYVGTEGSGVWRKRLKFDHTWEDFSTGLTDLNIKDLHIANGNFACVTSDGTLFTRDLSKSSWESKTSINDSICVACTVEPETNTTYGLYNLNGKFTFTDTGITVGSGCRSWVISYNGADSITTEILVSGMPSVGSYDIVSNGKDLFISVMGSGILSFEDTYIRNSQWINVDSMYRYANNYKVYNTTINFTPSNTVYKASSKYNTYAAKNYVFQSGSREDYVNDTYESFGGINNLIDENRSFYWTTTGSIYTSITIYGYIYNKLTSTTTQVFTDTVYAGTPGIGIPASLCSLAVTGNKIILAYGGATTSDATFSSIYYTVINADTLSNNGRNLAVSSTNTSLSMFEFLESRSTAYLRVRCGSSYYMVSFSIASGSYISHRNYSYSPSNCHVADFATDGYYGYNAYKVFYGNSTGESVVYDGALYDVKQLCASKNVTLMVMATGEVRYASGGSIGTITASIGDISTVADDFDNSIIFSSDGGSVKKYNPATGVTTTIITGLSLIGTLGICIGGQRIRVGSYIIYNTSSSGGTSVSAPKIVKRSGNNFTVVADTSDIQHLEVNIASPICSYAGFTLGELSYGSQYLSSTGYSGSWFYVWPTSAGSGGSYISDVRYYLKDGEPYIIRSRGNSLSPLTCIIEEFKLDPLVGWVTLSGVNVSGEVVYGNFDISRTITPTLENVFVSGNADHIETSNYDYNYTPYYFVSLSGNPSGESGSRFYQRDLDTDEFIERTNNLPEGKITMIRLDDII